jgi:hypothetical protein
LGEFACGFVSELGTCPEHGNFLRKIGEEALEKVLMFCRAEQPVEYLSALSQAAGDSWNGPSGERSRLVWIYNPGQLQLSELLFSPQGFIAFDEIVISDTHILIPIYYSVKEGIVSGCRACGQFFRPELNERSDS